MNGPKNGYKPVQTMQRDHTSLGDWLRERRRALDMTREDLARRVGCSWTTVKKIETGERRPSKQMAQLLAESLELPPEERVAFMRVARDETLLPAAKLPGSGPGETAPQEADACAPLTSPPARNNLPAMLTPLVGREALVATVRDSLQEEGARLLTVTGPPGIGKTRLALEVAWQMLGYFPDGVFFIALDSIREAGMMPAALVQVLELKDTNSTTPIALLSEALKRKRMLLLMDNFEQVVEAAPVVTHLLGASPGLRVLATSLAPLHVRGERQISLPPLDLPDVEQLPPLRELEHYSAVRLFVERAKAVCADFALTEENAPSVARICAQLDGLPLGIELVAARTKLLAPEALLDRLLGAYGESTLQMLTNGPRDLPARHRSFRNALDWSYNLLPPEEQKLFARLALFAGGCTLQAAQVICNAFGDMQMGTLDAVQSLVDKSLLRHVPGSEREPRVVMLGTIHEFAWEKLEESGDAEALQRRHTGYYQALAEAAELELAGAEQKLWVDRLSLEHDNIRRALRSALAGGDVETAARLAGSLWRFWLIRGFLSEGRQWLDKVLTAVSSVALSPPLRATLLHGAAVLAHNQGDHDRARELYEECLVLRRELGDLRGISHVLNNFGAFECSRHHYDIAQQLLEESLTIKRSLNDDLGIASSLNNLGEVAHEKGEHAQAEIFFEESVSRARAHGHALGIAVTLNGLADEVCRRGDIETARALFEEARALGLGLGDRMGLSRSLKGLGDVARCLNNCAEAEEYYMQALQFWHELGDKPDIALSLRAIAALKVHQGKWYMAGVLFGAAEAISGMPFAALSPAEQKEYEPLVEALCIQLDESAFAAARSEGMALPFEPLVEQVSHYLGRGRDADAATITNEDAFDSVF